MLNDLELEKGSRLAFVRRNGLGDLINSLPTLAYIKKVAPKVKITLFVDVKNASLAPYLSQMDEVVVLPPRGNKYLNLVRVGLQQRKKKFDIAISGKTSPMKLMNFFLFALGAKRRIASTDGHLCSRLINDPRPYDVGKADVAHQALKSLQMVAPHFHEVPKALYPKLTISPSVLNKYPLTENLPILLLSASTTKEASRLHPKRYAECVNAFCCTSPYKVFIVGEKKDQNRSQAIASFLTVPHALHFPRTFEEFMVLQSQCDLFFVGDGGVAHIAAALGKKGVVLFGGASPLQWAPLSELVVSLSHGSDVNKIDSNKVLETLKKLGVNRGAELSGGCVC